MKEKTAEKRQDAAVLAEKLMVLLELQGQERDILDRYLESHSLPQLLWEYSTLELSVNTERKLETIAALHLYGGSDVSWKAYGTLGTG